MATYELYFDFTLGNDSNAGTIASPFKSLSKAQSLLNSMTNGTDEATLYFKRGETWVFTSNSDCIDIKKSNVTLDAYGSGNKPVFDGDDQYPTGVSHTGSALNAAVMVAGGPAGSFTNVSIKNLRIQNMFPGGGVNFGGSSPNGNFRGPGLVSDCEIHNMGWAAVQITEVPNISGSSGAIKIERNNISKIAEWPKASGQKNWPQVLQSNTRINSGHEARYNIISEAWGEGIGAKGFRIIEYNVISGIKGPSVYYDAWSDDGPDCTIQYNLVWSPSDGYRSTGGIRINDERMNGDNSQATIEICGNVIIACLNGLDLRNDPADGTQQSAFGLVRAYNNTCIDNTRNFVVNRSEWFDTVHFHNNASIISADVEADCVHIVAWNSTDWTGWDISNNFYFGKSTTQESHLTVAAFRNDNVFGTVHPLNKTSGWRALVATPSLSDVSPHHSNPPASDSELIDNAGALALGSGFTDLFIGDGTVFSDDPDTLNFELKSQDDEGTNWTFGAVLSNTDTPPAPPAGAVYEYDPSDATTGNDPVIDDSDFSVRNTNSITIDISEIIEAETPVGTKLWRISTDEGKGPLIYNFDDVPATAVDQEILVLYRKTETIQTQCLPLSRLNDSGAVTCYATGMKWDEENNLIRKWDSGSKSTLGSGAHGITDQIDKWLWARGKIADNNLYVKSWSHAIDEPGSWQATGEDSGTVISNGSSGFFIWLNAEDTEATQTVDIAYFAVATEGEELPLPARKFSGILGTDSVSANLSTIQLSEAGLGLTIPSESPSLVLTGWHWGRSASNHDSVSEGETIELIDNVNGEPSRSIMTSKQGVFPETTTHVTWQDSHAEVTCGAGVSLSGEIEVKNKTADNTSGSLLLDELITSHNNNGDLVVVCVCVGGVPSISATYAGQAMTSISSVADGNKVELFILDAADYQGSNNVVVGLGAAARFSVFACSLEVVSLDEPISAPTNVHVVVNTNTRATVTWEAVEGACVYQVEARVRAGVLED